VLDYHEASQVNGLVEESIVSSDDSTSYFDIAKYVELHVIENQAKKQQRKH